jgi:hypothetical protein
MEGIDKATGESATPDPSPNWPYVLSPQHRTPPVVFNPQEKYCPVDIAEIELTPVTSTVALTDEVDPSPT